MGHRKGKGIRQFAKLRNRVTMVTLMCELILASVVMASPEEVVRGTEESNGYLWQYEIADKEATLANLLGPEPIDEISIPSVLGGTPVTRIGYKAFSRLGKLTGVRIPNGVRIIGNAAFCECNELETVLIPGSVTNIGVAAFSHCSELRNLQIPNGVKSIGESAFHGCKKLENITLPVGLKRIEEELFRECVGLKYIMIPETVNDIGQNTFKGCTALTSVVIPKSVVSIGAGAFENTGIVNLVIPDSVKQIGAGDPWGGGAFYFCNNLESVTIGKGIKRVGAWFVSTGITSIEIPDTVEYIEPFAFSNCRNLSKVTIGKGVVRIGYRAFAGCVNLSSIIIPSNVKHLEHDVFLECDSLVEVCLPAFFENKEPTAIANFFDSFASFKEINVHQPLKNRYHGDGKKRPPQDDMVIVYQDIQPIIVSSAPTPITSAAQTESATPTPIVSPSSLGQNENIKGKEDANGYTWAYHVIGTTTEITTGSFNRSAIAPAPIGAVVIPSTLGGGSVTGIGGFALFGCRGMRSVTIPNGITSIGRYAFSRCSKLEKVTIPDSVTEIGYRAFSSCDSLKRLELPVQFKGVDKRDHWGCTKDVEIIVRGE